LVALAANTSASVLAAVLKAHKLRVVRGATLREDVTSAQTAGVLMIFSLHRQLGVIFPDMSP